MVRNEAVAPTSSTTHERTAATRLGRLWQRIRSATAGGRDFILQIERMGRIHQRYRQAQAIGHAVVQAGQAAEIGRLAAH